MILPTKGIPPHKALLTLGAEILRVLDQTKTVSRLWEDFRRGGERHEEITFDWFVLSLDLLFIFGTIELDRGRVRRTATGGASDS